VVDVDASWSPNALTKLQRNHIGVPQLRTINASFAAAFATAYRPGRIVLRDHPLACRERLR